VALSGDISPMAALAMLFRFPAWLETGYSALAGGKDAAHLGNAGLQPPANSHK